MYSKREYITALQWHYNISEVTAENIYKAHIENNDIKHLDECVRGYRRNGQNKIKS